MQIAHQMGLVQVGDVAIDGSKAKANVSKHKAMSWKRSCQLEDQLSGEVAELMERAEQAACEQVEAESLLEEIQRRTERLEQIRQAKAIIKQRATRRYEKEKTAYDQKMAERETKKKQTGKKPPGRPPSPPEPGPRDKDQVNFTDPESRIMLTSSNGWQQAWNLQSCVDMNSYMILGGTITQATNDRQQLKPVLDQIEALPDSLGRVERVAADAGYFSEQNTELVTDHEADALHFPRPSAAPYELEEAPGRSRSAAGRSDAGGGNGLAAED